MEIKDANGNEVFFNEEDQDCCEWAAHFFVAGSPHWPTDVEQAVKNSSGIDLSTFVFEGEPFSLNPSTTSIYEGDYLFFLMKGEGDNRMYLCIFNEHNGYYGHSYSWSIDGKKGEGSL